ncbi:hypothetical protein ACQP1G_22595 [Nocardia sp. CA-107356]|uniref:hypothetical protein n=1 Tax=Nocardia sp. CA-107356 TaxID=3239972 RepID=UPI003D89FB25
MDIENVRTSDLRPGDRVFLDDGRRVLRTVTAVRQSGYTNMRNQSLCEVLYEGGEREISTPSKRWQRVRPLPRLTAADLSALAPWLMPNLGSAPPSSGGA